MKTILRWCLSALVLIAIGVAIPRASWAKDRFAVVDLRRAVADTEDGLRVQAKLQKLFDSRQAEYEAKERAYKEARAELEKLAKTGKTSQALLRKKYAALEKQAVELQQASVNYRREMQKQESEAMYPIVKQMLVLVRQVSQKDGFDMVLNKESVPYYRSDLDLTDRLVQMYNARSSAADDAGAKPTKKKRPTPGGKPAKKTK
jgi:outer membrane protein